MTTTVARGLSPVRTVLASGAVVIVQETSMTPAVTINATVQAGGVHEPSDRTGLAYLVGRVLDRGTAHRTADVLAEELDDRGVSLRIASSRHATIVSCTCLSEDFDDVLALVLDIVRTPVFPEEEVAKRKAAVAWKWGAVAQPAGVGALVPGRRRPVRARRLLPHVRARGGRGRGGLHHVPRAAGGFLMKVGKMREAFGRVNTEHPHTLPFAGPSAHLPEPPRRQALSDSGIWVARLVPIPWFFLEATGQVYRGESDLFEAPTRGDLQYVGRLRAYRDLTESTNLDVGGSIAYGNNGVTADSNTRLLGVDATLRWKPLRRSIYTSVLARGEAVWSRREDPPDVNAFGAYGYLGYQFARRWTAGVRLDTSERAETAAVRDRGGSFILTYRPSEFSLVRAQYRRTTFGEEKPVNELLFQFLFAIGAHGAHPF